MSKITSQPQNILSYFWEIASIDVGNRDSAVSSLLKSLVSFQQSYDSPIPWTPPSTFSELEPFLHPDVVYSLKRLLKGLASSREAARQGFTVALIELLRFVPQITIKPVLEYVDKVTEVTGSMKGQDEKEMYLGKVFSLIAITRSDMINRDGVPNADIEDMVKRLVEYARSKAYLEEICYNVLCEIIKEKKGDETFGQFLCDNYLPEGVQTPLQLQIVLAVGYYIPCRSSSSLISGVFDVKHLARLAEIMKETSSAHPRVHSVWEYLMARALGLRIDRIDLNTNTHEELLRYSESDRDDTLIPLQSLWREVIDNGLFTSTHERKYLGFKLFNSVAKLLPDTEIPVLFTPHFLRCLTNNLIKPDNYLAKVSRVTLSTVTELCNQHPKISIHIVTQLIGPHGAKNFDRLTKTKTVESILSNQSQEGLQSYIRYLKSIVLDQTVTTAVTVPTDGMDIVESEEVSEYAKRIDSNRQWAIDALYHLVKSSTIPLTSDIVKSIVQFFLTYSYFLVESTDISHGLQAPTPSLSESTYRLVRSRLISTLQELLSYRGQKISAKKDLDNALEWFRMVVDIMDSLISSDND
ncbi:hypothetical protein BKA69DRAFT_533978 [Paraphysoderma sedebokerense]|nr:hypothetical protein BKA69DRAFT_533978 [Paraphysoderma sedebokerense]